MTEMSVWFSSTAVRAGGERFVDVVLCSVDPLEYGITLEQARAGYGLRPLYSAHEWALRF